MFLWGRVLILFYNFLKTSISWYGGLELLIPTGSVAQNKVSSAAEACVGSQGLGVEVGLEGGGEETTTFFFKPSGLTATLSKFGQEKKCHSFF